jgi:hypothetical protein
MGGFEWLLEIALVVLLAATLFHALRLERALGVLKRDRASLEQIVSGFNESTRQAQAGIDQLRLAADSAGRQIARQIETGMILKDDLTFLIERSERAADRLDGAVRAARPLGGEPPRAERSAPAAAAAASLTPRAAPRPAPANADTEADNEGTRLRSQAERDLMKALRLAR